jgi:hypothetical protein
MLAAPAADRDEQRYKKGPDQQDDEHRQRDGNRIGEVN